MKKSLMPVMPTMCGSCPFRTDSEYADLKQYLAERSLSETRICHSTGRSGLKGRTGKAEKVCRGSRDLQLDVMHKLGVIASPTDEAWAEAWEAMTQGNPAASVDSAAHPE